MKLHALQWISLVPDAHDLALVGPRHDLELLGQGVRLDHQAMVARGLERVGEIAIDALAIMVNPRRLSMHDPLGTHDPRAEGMADALVPKANAQERYLGGEQGHQVIGNARFQGRTRTR